MGALPVSSGGSCAVVVGVAEVCFPTTRDAASDDYQDDNELDNNYCGYIGDRNSAVNRATHELRLPLVPPLTYHYSGTVPFDNNTKIEGKHCLLGSFVSFISQCLTAVFCGNSGIAATRITANDPR